MENEQKNGAAFTEGKIASPLIRFTLPLLFALLMQSLYGAVDLMVIGKFGTAADVSAVATGSQMMMTVTCLFTGLAVGTTVLLGQKLGAGKEDEAGDVIGSNVCFFAALALVVMGLMFLLAAPFTRLMNTPAEAVAGTLDYFRICSGGIVFIVAYNVLGSVFRGLGDSKTPLYTVMIACAFNILGDLLLVAVFRMRAAGAALATVFAQGISVAASLLIIMRRGLPFPFGRKNVRFNGRLILDTVRLGAPIALQDLLVSFSFLVINSIVNSLGLIFSAGVGVAERVCGFIMLVPMAFSQALSAFVAQNAGAGRDDRSKKAMGFGMLFSFAAGIVLAYLAFFHGDLLGRAFSKDAQVVAAAADYLKAYAIDTLLVSFLFCFLGYFNGCGKTAFVMAQGLVGAFLVRIPVSWLMSRADAPTLFGIGLATPASTVVQITMCVIYLIILRGMRKKERKEGKNDENEAESAAV